MVALEDTEKKVSDWDWHAEDDCDDDEFGDGDDEKEFGESSYVPVDNKNTSKKEESKPQ